jgi:beta-ureidopropionase / N-carbamoyl-L-amino-acid hydrolase
MAAARFLDTVPEPNFKLARELFDTLDANTRDGRGITRASYGDGEQFAHDLMASTARKVGLPVSSDVAGNLYITLKGRNPNAGTFLIASHLDSVPQGGNFDGAAGVIAGMAIVTAWKEADFVPAHDVAVMCIRAEESTWFPYSYIGSKGALGLLPTEALDVRRADTGLTLAEHIDKLGFDSESVRRRTPHWTAKHVKGYVELHIEQGPVLVGTDLPLALVTGIRGSFRYRDAKIIGEYGHSGAVPRTYRHDAVVAAADLVTQFHAHWIELESQGHDLTVTVGKFFTDPHEHAFSKIAGEVDLCIDVRSHSKATLDVVRHYLDALAKQIEAKHGVRFVSGPLTGSEPALMDEGLLDRFEGAAAALAVPHTRMPSGAGHDAAVFASAGIPTAMLFVRNQNGSHNPDESMRMSDFELAVRVINRGIASFSSP